MRALRCPCSAARARPGPGTLGLLVSALLGLTACGSDSPPRFEQVSLPQGAVRGEAPPRLTARVVDDREVVAVTAVVLDEAALREGDLPASADQLPPVDAGGFPAQLPLRPQGEDLWATNLPLPPAGDAYLYLLAWDAEDNSARAPAALLGDSEGPDGEQRAPALYVVPVWDRPLTPPVAACAELSCEPSEACHPQWGVCLPADHCAFPGAPCPDGTRCEPSDGRCTPQGRCPHAECPEWQACEPGSGRCLPLGHCALPGQACSEGQVCEDITGRCFRDDDCTVLGVTCPPGTVCDPERGVCESADPCERQVCGDEEACDTVSGLCEPLPRALCAPCSDSVDCGEDADLCVVYGDHRGCGRDCAERPCPETYVCEPFGADGRQCVRAARSCKPEDW